LFTLATGLMPMGMEWQMKDKKQSKVDWPEQNILSVQKG